MKNENKRSSCETKFLNEHGNKCDFAHGSDVRVWDRTKWLRMEIKFLGEILIVLLFLTGSYPLNALNNWVILRILLVIQRWLYLVRFFLSCWVIYRNCEGSPSLIFLRLILRPWQRNYRDSDLSRLTLSHENNFLT